MRLPHVEIGAAIPRILHQVYIRDDQPGAPLPEVLQRNVDHLRAQNPGWEHRLYDGPAVERFIAEHYGAEMLDLYRRINPEYAAARADLFRYLAVYLKGGVYLDLKSRFTRPIDEVIRGDEGFVVSHWRNEWGEVHGGWGVHPEYEGLPVKEIQQWHVIAAPGHPFLRAVIERVVKSIRRYNAFSYGVGTYGVLRLTGPIAYTLTIAPLLDKAPHRRVVNETEIGLEYSVLDGNNHQNVLVRHYTRNDSPVVLRSWPGSWVDGTYVAARKFKRALEKRTGVTVSLQNHSRLP